MRQPKIISIGHAVPPNAYSQSEIFKYLGYRSAQVRRIFENSGIDQRHSCIPPVAVASYTWQEQCECYHQAATELSVDAIRKCLDGRPLDGINCLCYASCTGYSCPAINYHIASSLSMKENVVHYPLIGLGCQAAIPCLRASYDFVRANGGVALSVATEICSATYFPHPEHDLEQVIACAIFADGSSAALIGYDEDPRHPYIMDFESGSDYSDTDKLGFRWDDGRLRVVLHKDIPKLVAPLVKRTVDRLLSRRGLTMSDISILVCHPGGVKVLDEVRDALGVDEDKMALSREGLRNFGNCSSSTVGLIAKALPLTEIAKTNTWGLVVSVGAGLASEAMLIKWGV